MNAGTEFGMMKRENDIESVIVNDEIDAEFDINDNDIIPSISLTDKVKELIEDLIVEQLAHKEKQSRCFEELLRIWFGENFTLRLIKDHQEHTERLFGCKKYVCRMIGKYLPDGDSELYTAYFSLKRDGKYEVHAGDVCTVYGIKDVDMGEYAKYIGNINRKVVNQYKILLHNFELYLAEKAEEEYLIENMENVPLRIRIKSQRNTTKVTDYKPFLKFNSTKRKNRPKSIDDFHKTITAMKKAKIIPKDSKLVAAPATPVDIAKDGGKDEVEEVRVSSESTLGVTSYSNNNINNIEFTANSTISNNYTGTDHKLQYSFVNPTFTAPSPTAPQIATGASVPSADPVVQQYFTSTNSLKPSSTGSASTSSPPLATWDLPPGIASATPPVRSPVLPPPGIVSDVTLSTRLENCASYPNFSDALSGLCAWASVAGLSDIQNFYECKALEIILETLISDTTQIIRPVIRTDLTTLLHRILPIFNGGSNAVTSVIFLLENLAIQINSTKSSKIFTENPKNLATIVAYRVAASLRRLHTALKSFQSSGNIQATLSNLDAALAETVAALDRHTEEYRAESTLRQSAQIDLKSAFIFRELQHERLELELQAAEALREASLQPRSQVSVPYLGGSSEDDIILEASLLAEAGESKGSIEAKKNQAFAARSFLENVLAEHSNRVAPLKNQLRDCVSQIADLYQQHQLLTSQIMKVEKDIEASNTRKSFLQTSIEKEESKYNQKISSMDSTQSHVLNALNLDDNVNAIIHKVRELEGGLSAVVIGGTPQPLAPPAEEYPVRIAAASEALGAYIESETKCIAVLARRISLVETRAIHLRREIEEYKNLGMQSVGLEIETTMKKLKENAEEDQATLSALLSALATAVRRFVSCLTVDLAGVGLVTLPLAAITQAVATLTEAGVPVPQELLTLVISTPPPPPPGLTAPPSKHPHPSYTAPPPATAKAAVPPSVTTTTTTIPQNVTAAIHSNHNKTSSKPAATPVTHFVKAHPNAGATTGNTSAQVHPPAGSHSSFQSHQASQGQHRLSTGTANNNHTPSSHQKSSIINPAVTTSARPAAKPQSQSQQTPEKTTTLNKSPTNQTPKSQGQGQGKPSKQTQGQNQPPKTQGQGQGQGVPPTQGRKKNPPSGGGAAATNAVARPPPVASVKDSKNPPVGSLKPVGRPSTSQPPSGAATTGTAASSAAPTTDNKKETAWKGWSNSDKRNTNPTTVPTTAAATGPVKSLLDIQIILQKEEEEGEGRRVPAASSDIDNNSNGQPVVVVSEQLSEMKLVEQEVASHPTAATSSADEDEVELPAAPAVVEVPGEEEVEEEEVVPQSEENVDGVDDEVDEPKSQVSKEIKSETAVEGEEDSNPLERRSRRSRRE